MVKYTKNPVENAQKRLEEEIRHEANGGKYPEVQYWRAYLDGAQAQEYYYTQKEKEGKLMEKLIGRVAEALVYIEGCEVLSDNEKYSLRSHVISIAEAQLEPEQALELEYALGLARDGDDYPDDDECEEE